MTAPWPRAEPWGEAGEHALVCAPDSPSRILIVPALFEEANRTRRMLVECMALLGERGIGSVLPDLPGCNESMAPLDQQSLASWRTAMAQAASHFAATHVLTIRGGALVAPADIPGWSLEPARGASLLRQLVRARIIATRENGRDETSEGLAEIARRDGIELAGYRVGPSLFAELEAASPETGSRIAIEQGQLGGPALWLRSEPDAAPDQSRALADIIADGIDA